MTSIAERFRGFLPVVVDVETSGFDAHKNALLEIACVPILQDSNGQLVKGESIQAHIIPFAGADLDPRALAFTGIDLKNPLRALIAEDEKTALKRIFKVLTEVRRANNCTHCVLVGHNAHFDLGFLNAAIARTHTKNQSPFHQFSVFDTVTLSAMAFGQTVLAKSCAAAGIAFSSKEAHHALYDTEKTAELFCKILNFYPQMPQASTADDQDDNESLDDQIEDENEDYAG